MQQGAVFWHPLIGDDNAEEHHLFIKQKKCEKLELKIFLDLGRDLSLRGGSWSQTS